MKIQDLRLQYCRTYNLLRGQPFGDEDMREIMHIYMNDVEAWMSPENLVRYKGPRRADRPEGQ